MTADLPIHLLPPLSEGDWVEFDCRWRDDEEQPKLFGDLYGFFQANDEFSMTLGNGQSGRWRVVGMETPLHSVDRVMTSRVRLRRVGTEEPPR